MRILQLRFKNLNSLAGEWRIDFTHPAYAASGIFAITGPTGSGKTTILDAICLALYGQTPRLKIISRSTNEIMTRDTGECFAEVVFESEKGQFVCHWSQHRSFRKAEGDLQPPKHEISEFRSQKILENKLARVLSRVIETTGLDFQQFTRSILLAQGDFAAFLHANPDERAPILEKITGTEIYSEISKKVHERHSLETTKKKDLKERMEGLELLPPDRIAGLKEEFQGIEREVRTVRSRQEILRDAVTWLQKVTRLTTEVEDLTRRKAIASGKREKAAGDLARLSRARKALPLEESFSLLQSSRDLAAGYQQEIEEKTHRLAEMESAYASSSFLHEETRKRFDSVKAVHEKEKLLIVQVRNLDVRIAGINQQIGERRGELERLQEKILKDQMTIAASLQEISRKERLLESDAAYLNEHERDGRLTEELPGLETRILQYIQLAKSTAEARKHLDQEERELIGLKESFSAGKELLTEKESAFEKTRGEFQKLQDCYAGLLGGYEAKTWRTWATTLLKRKIRLEGEVKIFESIGKNGKKIKELREERAVLVDDLLKKKLILSGMEDQQVVREQFIARMEADLAHFQRAQSLEEERGRLEDGKPCPLCGSPDHPYTRGRVLVPDQVKDELIQKKEEFQALLENIRLQNESILKSEADIHLNEETEREKTDQVRELLKESGTGFEDIEFVIESRDVLDMFEEALESCEVHYFWCRDISESADVFEKELSGTRDAMVAARESLSLHQVACQRMEGDIDRVAQKINELKRQLIDDEGECATLQEEVSKILDDFGVKLKGGQDPDELIRSLKQRKQAFEDAMNRKRELERDTGLLSRDIENGRMRLDEDQKTVDSLSQIIREKEEASSGLSKERIGLYGTKDPDLEEKRIAETVAAIEREFLKSSESQKDSESRVSSLRDQIGSVTGKFKELRESLERMEKAFAKRIREAGFSDENDFITMRIPRDEFESLERMEKELLFEEKDISTRLKETLRNLEEEHVRAVTERQIPELQVEIAACDEAIADLNSTLGRIRQKLEDHEKLAAQQKDLLQALERQEIECLRWEKLHDLIGSADGKRFRVFAQGLTFDRLIAHANRNLQKMSDRYLLVRKENSSLDLDIIDGYQAGEIRSTKNLSGGESFIVSLALALGLSGMASRNVRIDSLFLDEGFGTLDSDTLEVALGTLSTLQQEGKMIGIISHVPALKERIPTKITVIKKAGGRSRIIGPGCTSTSMQ